MTKIIVDHVSKVYRERRRKRREPRACRFGETCTVIEGVSFTVAAGSLVCFLGPSGCGKSTLLRMIAGFTTPSAGQILVDGKVVTGPQTGHIFVFQEDGLFPWMTARENVAVGARRYTDKRERRARVLEYLDLVGLAGFENHYPYELSGGMRRRVEIARALIANPEILFLDEPFGALDFVTRMQMREEILNVHAMFPTTILFITHDIDEALQLGDHVIVLSERPSRILEDLHLSHPHPRDVTKDELARLRQRIHFLMGLHSAL